MYIYTYIYIYVNIYVYIYVYINIRRPVGRLAPGRLAPGRLAPGRPAHGNKYDALHDRLDALSAASRLDGKWLFMRPADSDLLRELVCAILVYTAMP